VAATCTVADATYSLKCRPAGNTRQGARRTRAAGFCYSPRSVLTQAGGSHVRSRCPDVRYPSTARPIPTDSCKHSGPERCANSRQDTNELDRDATAGELVDFALRGLRALAARPVDGRFSFTAMKAATA
jgi:hypothetical protein